MSQNQPPPYPGDEPDPSASGPQAHPTWGSTQPGDGAPPAWGEQQHPSYPAPEPYQEPYSAADAIGWGWRAFTQNLGPVAAAIGTYLGVGVLVTLVSAGLLGFDALDPQTLDEVTPGYVVVQVVSAVLSIYLMCAFFRASLDLADGGRFDFFGALRRVNLLHAVVGGVLVYLMVVLGLVLLLVPGLVLAFFSWFTLWAVVDGRRPFAAIGHSFTIVGRNVGQSLLLAVLTILVLVAGTLALLVGLLVAWPVTVLAAAYSYRRFGGQPVAG
jgi:hypothetical protein